MILQGDAITELAKFETNTVNSCFTCPNPPFFLKESSNIIGSEENSADYIKNLVRVFDSVKRIMTVQGSLFVNLGDYYEDELTLRCIPEMFVLTMISNGWYLKANLIWHRTESNTVQRNTNRFKRNWEYIYHFVKDPKRYYFNNKNRFYKTSVFSYPYRYRKGVFDSGFPREIIEIIIETTVPRHGIILDPFAGTGLVGSVAKKLNRNYIMIDISKQMCEGMRERLHEIV